MHFLDLPTLDSALIERNYSASTESRRSSTASIDTEETEGGCFPTHLRTANKVITSSIATIRCRTHTNHHCSLPRGRSRYPPAASGLCPASAFGIVSKAEDEPGRLPAKQDASSPSSCVQERRIRKKPRRSQHPFCFLRNSWAVSRLPGEN